MPILKNVMPDSMIPRKTIFTKYEFRNLLTMNQKIVFDNFVALKTSLNLTELQIILFTTFKADFDAAINISIEDPILIDGLNLIASWNLEYNGQLVFTQEDVDLILGIENILNEDLDNIE